MPVIDDVQLHITPTLLSHFAERFRAALGRVESVHCRIASNAIGFIDPAVYDAFCADIAGHLRPGLTIGLHALQRHFLAWRSEPFLRSLDKETMTTAPYLCIFTAAMNGIGDDDLTLIIADLNEE